MKHKLINGWTKEKVMEQFKKRNNGRKAGGGFKCFYRTKDGNACAAGAFIPDEVYNEKIETISIGYLLNPNSKHFISGLVELMPMNRTGMQALQLCHDTCRPYNTYEVIQKFLDEEVE